MEMLQGFLGTIFYACGMDMWSGKGHTTKITRHKVDCNENEQHDPENLYDETEKSERDVEAIHELFQEFELMIRGLVIESWKTILFCWDLPGRLHRMWESWCYQTSKRRASIL